GTQGEVELDFKALDVTTRYGEDYRIKVGDSFFSETLEADPDARPMVDSFLEVSDIKETDGSEEEVIAVIDDAASDSAVTVQSVIGENPFKDESENTAEQNNASDNENSDNENNDEEASTTEETTSIQTLSEESGEVVSENSEKSSTKRRSGNLKNAANAFRGENYEYTDPDGTQRKDTSNQDALEMADDAINEWAQENPGVGTKLKFADGEYMKKIVVEIIDDSVSESDEEVIFALLNPTAGTLGEGSRAFLNITDNDEDELQKFELAESDISVRRTEGKVDITVKRTAGIQKFGSVTIATAEITAVHDVDYAAIAQDVVFPQGVTERTISIPILKKEASQDGLQFSVNLDRTSKIVNAAKSQTIVTLNNDNADFAMETGEMSLLSEEEQYEEIAGFKHDEEGYYKEIILDESELSMLDYGNSEKAQDSSQHNIDCSNYNQENTYAINSVDLSMVKKIKVNWENSTGGTYWERRGKCDKVEASGYHTDGDNWVTFGSDSTKFRPSNYSNIKFGRQDTEISVPQNSSAKKKYSNITFHTRTSGSNRYSNLRVYSVRLYYAPVEISIGTNMNSQVDNNSAFNVLIDRREWTVRKDDSQGYSFDKDNNTSYTVTQKGVVAGSLKFNDTTKTSKTAYFEKTISFDPVYTLGKDEVYLAGIVLSGKSNDKLLKGTTSITLNADFISNYKDYITDPYGENPKITVMPVYYPRASFLYFPVNNGGYMVSHSNESTNVMKINMTDTVKLQNVANSGKFVEGFNIYGTDSLDMNENSIRETSITNMKKNKINDKTFPKITDGKGITWNKNDSSYLTIVPKKSVMKIEPFYSYPYLTVMANPNNTYKEQGAVFYADDKKKYEGNSKTPLVINSISAGKSYQINSIAKDNYMTKWQDVTGISDVKSGKLTVEDAKAMEGYNIDRAAVNGTVYNYVAGRFATPIIFYGFYPEYKSATKGAVEGQVFYNSKPVFAKNYTRSPIENAMVSVGTLSTRTDMNGKFSIVSDTFLDSENASISIYLEDTGYTYVPDKMPSVNLAQIYNIDEYSTFSVVGARLFKDGTEIKTNDVENFDAKLKIELKTKSDSAILYPQKAIFKTYAKDGQLLFTDTVTSSNNDGIFNYEINPSAKGVTAGAKMTVQFFDQNGKGYFVHDLGFIFKRNMKTFNILTSFMPRTSPVLDLLGSLDIGVNMGFGGKTDNYFETSTVTEMGQTFNYKTMVFGYTADSAKSGTTLNDLSGKLKKNIDNKLKKKKGEEKKEEEKTEKEKKEDAESTDDAIHKEADKVTDKDKKENKKETKLSSKVKMGFAIGVKVVMQESTNPDKIGEYSFKSLLFTAKCTASVGVSAKIPTPIGITITIGFEVGGELSGAVLIERGRNGKESFFDGDGGIDFGNMTMLSGDTSVSPNSDFTFFGSLRVSPSITLKAGADATILEVEVSGTAKFDLDFDTIGNSSGKVTFTAKLSMTVLKIFTKEWKLVEKEFDMFSDDDIIKNTPISEMERADISYMKNRGSWNGDAIAVLSEDVPVTENVLLEGTNPYPNGVMEKLPDGRYIYVFIDDNISKDKSNYADVKYSVFSSGSWSNPESIDNDGTADSNPDIYVLDNGTVMAVWSSASEKITESDNAMDALSKMDIKSAIYRNGSFSEPVTVTHTNNADYSADTLPKLAKAKRDGKDVLLMYYTKTEYTASEGDGVISDLVDPYSLIAYMFYDIDSGEWIKTYSEADKSEIISYGDARTSDGQIVTADNFGIYENEWYGQGFAKLGSNVIINDSDITDSRGFWTSVATISEKDGNKDPKIIDNDAYTDDDHVFFAYTADLDGDLQTAYDREIYVQVYNSTTNNFYYPIQVTSNDIYDSNVTLGKFGNSVYLVWISNGDIKYLNMTNTYDNCLLEKTVGGEKIYIINKSLQEAYQPETILADAGEEQEIGEYKIATDGENNVYVIWIQPGISYKDGIEKTMPEAALPENQYSESQIFAARYTDSATGMGKWSGAVQVTDEKGANYAELAFAVTGKGVNAIATKGRSTYTKEQGVFEDISSRKLVTLGFSAVDKLEITDVDFTQEFGTGTHLAEVTVKNKGFDEHTDAYVEFYVNGKSAGKVSIESIDSQKEVIVSAEVESGEFEAKLFTADGEVDSYKVDGEIKPYVDIPYLYSEIAKRDTVEFTAEIENEGALDIENGVIAISSVATGEKIGEYTVDFLPAGQSQTINFFVDITDDVFVKAEEISDSNNNIEEIAEFDVDFEGVIKTTSVKRYLTNEEKDILDKAEPVINDGAESVDVNANDYDLVYTNVTDENSKLQVIWESSDESVATVMENGLIYGVKPGKATITAKIMPRDRVIHLLEDNASNNELIYDVLPAEGIITKTIEVNVLEAAVSESTTEVTTSEKTTGKSSDSDVKNSSSGSGSGSGSGNASSKASGVNEELKATTSGSKTSAGEETETGTLKFTAPNGTVIIPPTKAVYAKTFNDLAGRSWSESAIGKLASLGIVSGVSESRFDPDASSKRADFVIMLDKILGLGGYAKDNFDDVSSDKYYANYVGLAKEAGVASGYGDGNFGPEKSLTRQDMMVLVAKTVEFCGEDISTDVNVLDKFDDNDEMADYAKPYAAYLVSQGMVNGTGNDIEPTKDMTRAQMAVLMNKLYDKVYEIALAKNVAEQASTTEESTESVTVESETGESTEVTTEAAAQ
ncbi:MAG: S-layer homology domain-containing protein, partial [Firmicutes bacterium]|nr:S-layer homology domain-containing protein [Bacillota bacterium]